MKTEPWTDEWGNALDSRELEKASRYWTAEDWKRFQQAYPEDLGPCGVQLDNANEIETAFGDDEISLWDFIGDDVPTHLLEKLPELKAVIEGLPNIQYQILRCFYLEKKTDREIAELFWKPRSSVTWIRSKARKKLLNALEEDKRKGFLKCHITI